MKKTAIALALGVILSLSGATVALADETAPPAEDQVVAVEQPAAAPAPAPAPEEQTPVSAPSKEKKVEKPPVLTEWYTWRMPAGSSDQNVKFPQALVGAGIIDSTECGVWYQQDKYVGTRDEIDAVLDGDKLTKGEDYGVVKDWSFSYGGDCKPDKPTKDPLVVYGEFGGDQPTCEVPVVEWTRTKTVTTYDYTWNGKKWVEKATTVVTTDTETETHRVDPSQCQPPAKQVHEQIKACDLTAYGFEGKSGVVERDGLKAYVWNGKKWVLGDDIVWDAWQLKREFTDEQYFKNCAPEMPVKESKVEVGEFGGAKPSCENKSVTWHRDITTTTYSYTWDLAARAWVESSETAVTQDEETKLVTYDGDCTPDEPRDGAGQLARTGSSDGAGQLAAFGILCLAIGGAMLARRRIA